MVMSSNGRSSSNRSKTVETLFIDKYPNSCQSMLEPHLVNDQDLIVFLGDLLAAVGDVTAAMLRVNLSTVISS